MNFETYIYEPSPDKEKHEFKEMMIIIGVIIALLLIYIMLFQGIMPLVIIGVIAFSLVAIKIKENKRKGVQRVGSLPFKMTLNVEFLTIGKIKYNVNELRNFKIKATDYIGKTSDFFGTENGINNYLSFTYNGTTHTYQFQINSRQELKIINQILNNINSTNPN